MAEQGNRASDSTAAAGAAGGIINIYRGFIVADLASDCFGHCLEPTLGKGGVTYGVAWSVLPFS